MTNLVQILNPKTKRYVKIDRDIGKVVGHKASLGPYKGIPIREVQQAGAQAAEEEAGAQEAMTTSKGDFE